jgi:hypothetical protein
MFESLFQEQRLGNGLNLAAVVQTPQRILLHSHFYPSGVPSALAFAAAEEQRLETDEGGNCMLQPDEKAKLERALAQG